MPPVRQTVRTPEQAQPAAPPKKAAAPKSSPAALQRRIGNGGMLKLVASQRSGAGSAPAGPAPAGKAPPKPHVPKQGRTGRPVAGAAESGADKARAPAPEASGEGGGGAGKAVAAVSVQLHMPEPPSGPSPASVRRIQAVQARAGGAAAAHSAMPSGGALVGDARKAVAPPAAETEAAAQAALIAQVQAAPSPEIVKLCENIRDVIKRKRPPDEDALMEAKPEAAATEAGNQLNATVDSEAKKVQSNYGAINEPADPAAPPKPPPIPGQPPVPATPAVNAQSATPDAVPASAVSLDKDAAESKAKAEKAGMDTAPAQLIKTGPVAEARAAQSELDQTASEGPAQVLAKQKQALGHAEAGMASLGAQALAALTASRETAAGSNSNRQTSMVGSEESMRASAGAEAKKVFDEARTAVDGLLNGLPEKAMDEWNAAKDLLVSKFKSDLAEVQKRVDERHAGVGGFIVGLWDAVTGLPAWAEKAYSTAETNFGNGVIEKLKAISTKVNAVIAACDLIIKGARERIAKIFAALPESLRGWAAKEQAGFDSQLDKLHDQAIAARDGFNKGLKESASAAVDEVRAEVAELRKKAGGLVGRIAAAVNRFLDDPVKFIIEGLLELLGIPPAAFWAVVAKIKKVVKDIAADPLGFADNLLKGLAKGFGQFFDNFGEHMIRGFLSWLFGDLKGVKVPKDVTLKSVITFFLQLMGITWPNIRKILVDKIGPKNVALIEKAWSLISMLIEMGPEGIYEMIKEKLSPQSIVDQVVEMAVDYMVTAIAKQAAVRLLLLFNPVGAIAQALEAIYRVLKWIFQNAARIFSLVETVVNGIADIVAGNVGGFATAVETALEKLIAPVLGFIADYFGFGDLPATVADKIRAMQKWILGHIATAIGWIIDKGKALLAAVGIGKKKDDKKGDGKFDGKIGDTVHWKAEGESHELWIEDVGGQPEPMMASADKGPVKRKLKDYAALAKALKGPGAADRRERAEAAITQAGGILDGTIAAAKATKAAAADPNAKPADVKAKDDETESWEDQLWPQLQVIQIALRIIPLPKTKIRGGGVKAGTVVAEPLTKIGDTGSTPRGKMKGWDHVCRVDRAELNPKKGQWGPAFWVRGHLISDWLHGPGDPWNTVPLRKVDNGAMEREIERPAWLRTLNEEVLTYTATVTYFDGRIVEDFPNSITITWGSMRFDKGHWVPGEDFAPYTVQPDPPPLKGGLAPDINSLGLSSLYKLDVPFRFAEAMVNERKARGKFDASDFAPRMKSVYATRGGAAEDKLDEGLKSIERLIDDDKIAFPK